MGHWKWVSDRGVSAVARVEDEWRALAKQAGSRFMAGPTWNRAYIRAFAFDAEVRALYYGSHLAAVAVFRGENSVRTLEENEHFPVCDVAVDWSLPGVADVLLDDWIDGQSELMLARLPADGALARAFELAARSRGNEIAICRSQGDAFLPLTGGVDTVRSLFSGRSIRDSRKHEANLINLGHLTVHHETHITRALLAEALELEAAGWKGREGSPIAAQPETKAFYETLADLGSRNNEMVLHSLRLDGKMIAFELATRSCGRMDVLKIGYDETHAKHSPGNVLRWHVIESEAAKGEIASYHFGRPSPWKTRWATQIADLASVRIYAGLAGRAKYWASIAPRMWAKENLGEVVSAVRTLTGRPEAQVFEPRRTSAPPANRVSTPRPPLRASAPPALSLTKVPNGLPGLRLARLPDMSPELEIVGLPEEHDVPADSTVRIKSPASHAQVPRSNVG